MYRRPDISGQAEPADASVKNMAAVATRTLRMDCFQNGRNLNYISMVLARPHRTYLPCRWTESEFANVPGRSTLTVFQPVAGFGVPKMLAGRRLSLPAFCFSLQVGMTVR